MADCEKILDLLFQSTPPMRRETPRDLQKVSDADISIHSPHAEGDWAQRTRRPARHYFNPLPHAEGDLPL